MSRFNHKKDYTVRDIVMRVLAIAALTTVAVIFMPRSQTADYTYSTGHPWRYRDIIAEHDFPVFKTQERLKAEQDSIKRLFMPYYANDAKMLDRQLQNFRSEALRRQVPLAYRHYVAQALTQVYTTGIVTRDELETRLAKRTAIRIVEGNTSLVRQVKQLFTPKTAYEYIINNADSTQISHQYLRHLDLSDYVDASLTYDQRRSETALRDLMATVPKSSGMIMSGTRVVSRGDIVTDEQARVIDSYIKDRESLQSSGIEIYTTLAGQALFACTVLTLLLFYFDLFRRDYMSSGRSMSLIATLVLSFPLITYALIRHDVTWEYIVPYSMVPVFVRIFLDSRTAFMTHVAVVLLSAIATHSPFVFVAIEIVTGMVAIFSLRELSERSQIFRAALLVTVVAAIMRFSIDLISAPDLGGIDFNSYIAIAIGGVVLICAYPLLFPVERLFGFTSNVTLVELSNVNTPLLRRMTEVAPGTFQHSMQVANLASEVALKIGGKSQLVRTGALYHDIGKIKNAAFFTENQRGLNPHDQLSPQQSAQYIIAHVRDGLELAAQQRLPQVIRDFIATHHGCGMAKYFYITAKNQGLEPDPQAFSYPGPNPTTLEQAILMMCDAVEAASRSLKQYTDQEVSQLVDRIIDQQVADGYFTQCPITFRDIADAKQVLKAKLRTIYHTRIEYPKEKK